MDTLEWLSAVSQGDSRNMVATKAGLYAATLNKQVARGHLSPEVVVAIARAYVPKLTAAQAARFAQVVAARG